MSETNISQIFALAFGLDHVSVAVISIILAKQKYSVDKDCRWRLLAESGADGIVSRPAIAGTLSSS